MTSKIYQTNFSHYLSLKLLHIFITDAWSILKYEYWTDNIILRK